MVLNNDIDKPSLVEQNVPPVLWGKITAVQKTYYMRFGALCVSEKKCVMNLINRA